MPRLAPALVLVLLAGCAAGAVAVSAPAYRVERVSLEEGVSHNLVFCLHRDREGFLWIGTMYGLVRYDGHRYVTFRHDPRDEGTLSNDDILSIAESRNGDLWVATYGGGVNRLDRRTGRVTRFPSEPAGGGATPRSIVWAIAEDRDGSVWLGTNGALERLDPETGARVRYVHDPDDPSSLGRGRVASIHVDRSGSLRVGTAGGLQRFERETETFRAVPLGSDGPAPVTVILEDRRGDFWVGTAGAGLYLRSGPAGEFRSYRYDPRDPRTLPSDRIRSLAREEGGALWVGTMEGLARLDPETGAADRYVHDPEDDATIRSNRVVTLLADPSGVLWAGSYQGGLDRLVPEAGPFTPERVGAEVHAFAEEGDGTFWIGTSRGAGREGEDGEWRWYLSDPGELPAGGIRALLVTRSGALYGGGREGLARYDRERERWNPVRPGGEDLPPGVTALLEDRKGDLWVGTGNGLARLGREGGKITLYRHDPGDNRSLPDNTVLSLYEDREGRVWAGTFGGLVRHDPDGAGFVRYVQDPADPASISNNYAYAYLEDEKGRFWIGTGGGLNRFHERTGTFEAVTERDGLPNGVVVGLAPGGGGSLWLATHRGLARYEPDTGRISSYGPEDGLQSNLFLPGAAAVLADGRVAFGGIRGFHRFDPRSIESGEEPPPVSLVSFAWGGDGGERLVDRFPGDPVRLPHDRASFTIDFAALDLFRPERHRYAYRLEGLERKWNECGPGESAVYRSVPPGRYVFHVKGATGDGAWNEEGARLSIRIDPPFWRTRWFAGLSVLAAAGVLATAHGLRVRSRLRRLEETEEARREERDRVRRRAARDFHDELGHRLTKIGLFSEMVRRKFPDPPEEVAGYIDRIAEESHRLSNDTRDFLWTLDPARNTLADLAAYLRDFGNELFERTETEFEVRGMEEDLGGLRLSAETRRHVILIFKEAMTNALKHAKCRRVELNIETEGDRFTLRLTDDGQGYEEGSAYSGHGLRNMEQRARIIRGDLEVGTGPGLGSTICLRARCETGMAGG